MTRRTLVVALAALSLGGGLAGSAAAAPDTERICLSSSTDPKHQGTEPICVWIPISLGR